MDTIDLDQDNQPINRRFNATRNLEKHLNELLGVLEGLVADKDINEREIKFLEQWLEVQDAIADDYDVFDLKEMITQILEDGIVTRFEIDFLKAEINDIIRYKQVDNSGVEAKINNLLGLISGISADDKLTADEITSLCNWLNNNYEEISTSWPACVIIQKMEEILEDGIITPEEQIDLLSFLKQIVGKNASETGIMHKMSTGFFHCKVDNFEHENKNICFTGKFISGTRKEVEQKAKNLGAKTSKQVSSKVNVVVLGSLASRDWRFSNYGRKIEAALKLRESGHDINIFSEEVWLEFID